MSGVVPASSAADYELNSLSTRARSPILSFTLLHNSYDLWQAAASPGIFVDHSFELLFPSMICFSFVEPHCQDVLFPLRESPGSTRSHEMNKYELTRQILINFPRKPYFGSNI